MIKMSNNSLLYLFREYIFLKLLIAPWEMFFLVCNGWAMDLSWLISLMTVLLYINTSLSGNLNWFNLHLQLLFLPNNSNISISFFVIPSTFQQWAKIHYFEAGWFPKYRSELNGKKVKKLYFLYILQELAITLSKIIIQ